MVSSCPNFQGTSIFSRTIPEEARDFKAVIDEVYCNVLTSGLNATSPRYLAFVPPGGIPAAALADFLAALTNRYSGLYAACPGAVEVENHAIAWLRDMVSYPETAWGTLLSGGTTAALAAMVAARDTRPQERWHKGVIYRSSECHHSLEKVLKTIGLGNLLIRELPIDQRCSMRVDALAEQVKADHRQGYEPWIILATAGTTNTGAIDPLEELAQLARKEQMWLHADGAYGGMFMLTESGRKKLSGICEADSIVLDPHKSMFLPYGLGAVLLKRGELLRNTAPTRPATSRTLAKTLTAHPLIILLKGQGTFGLYAFG